MKHLKIFKKFEAVIMPPKLDPVISFPTTRPVNSFEAAVEFGQTHGFDVVDYDTFYNSLSEKNKKTAPPRHGIPFFALFNPSTKKPMFVLVDPNAPKFIPNFKEIITDIIRHEKVHQEQSKRKDKIAYELPNPIDRKSYFSNKDEIMAFSWTIANGLSKTNSNIKDAISDLDAKIGFASRVYSGEHKMLWNDIKRNCSEDIIKRYRKYIYMYLEKIFNKNDKME